MPLSLRPSKNASLRATGYKRTPEHVYNHVSKPGHPPPDRVPCSFCVSASVPVICGAVTCLFFPFFYVPVAVALSFLPFILSVSFLHCHFSCSYNSYNSPHFPFRLGYSIFLRCCRWEKGLVPLDITDTSGMTTLLVYWPTFYVVVVLVVSFSARSLNFSR